MTARLRLGACTGSCLPYTAHAGFLVIEHPIRIFKVRTGEGAQPSYRGGKVQGTTEAIVTEVEHVLAEMKGAVGERKRKNLQALRQEVLGSLAEGGDATVALRGLSRNDLAGDA